MRSDRKQQQKIEQKEQVKEAKRNRSGLAKFTKVWALVFLGINIITGLLILLANILAPKYLLVAGLIALLLFIIVFPPLYSYKTRNGQRIIALILSIAVAGIYLFGDRYLASTMDFMSRITKITSSDEYYVVVRDDDMFNELADTAGETVHAYSNNSSLEDAISELRSKVEVSVSTETDLNATVESLLDGTINVTLLNAGSYEVYNDQDPSFEDYTKIIDKFKISRKIIDISKPVEVADEAFNVYITGIDTAGTIDVTARSDVNMIATINPATKTILLTSIPRDYYVRLPDVDAYDKLTHTGLSGADYTIRTAEELLGVDINYYVKVNFTTVVTLVDAIGGIDINSDYAFTSRIGGYYFEQGWNTVNGDQALAFARERYAFTDGDFQRNKDQQIVLTAIINKITQSSTLLLHYSDILNALEGQLEMNLSADDLKTFIRMQTADMSAWNVVNQSVVGATSSEYCYSMGQYLSVVLQDQESMNAAVQKIDAVMAGETVE